MNGIGQQANPYVSPLPNVHLFNFNVSITKLRLFIFFVNNGCFIFFTIGTLAPTWFKFKLGLFIQPI